jgi:L-alanine-DL-glutamate epimerase-like enolase superfamily enzyme
VPNAILVEYISQLGSFLEVDFALADGEMVAPDTPGHGIRFDWEKLEYHRVS